MRAYRAAEEEALLARNLVKDWAGEGFVTPQQQQVMEQETGCELRRTNIFLRLVLFCFTLLIVGAALGLFAFVAFQGSNQQGLGIFLLAGGVACYVAAELAVSQGRLYRFGIEEALLVCAVGLLFAGVYAVLTDRSRLFSVGREDAEFVAPAAAAILSLWIWHRFGLFYFFLAAMAFAVWLPVYLTSSVTTRHIAFVGMFAAGLLVVAAVGARQRFTYLRQHFSIAEASLWFGIYLATNLQISALQMGGLGWITSRTNADFSDTFYWGTWVLTWCLPAVMLARGIRQRDRFVIAVGAVAAVLTLLTNKAYLGGQRHTWDAMLFGGLLIAVALGIRHWLGQGPNETRRGFTARRLSGKDKAWMNAATTAVGFASPGVVATSSQPASPEVQFGGGDSGGGGASSNW